MLSVCMRISSTEHAVEIIMDSRKNEAGGWHTLEASRDRKRSWNACSLLLKSIYWIVFARTIGFIVVPVSLLA